MYDVRIVKHARSPTDRWHNRRTVNTTASAAVDRESTVNRRAQSGSTRVVRYFLLPSVNGYIFFFFARFVFRCDWQSSKIVLPSIPVMGVRPIYYPWTYLCIGTSLRITNQQTILDLSAYDIIIMISTFNFWYAITIYREANGNYDYVKKLLGFSKNVILTRPIMDINGDTALKLSKKITIKRSLNNMFSND